MSIAEPCASVVELTISCRNLLDMDVFSKSDPMVVVCLMHPVHKTWSEIGRTETVWDNLNPEFSKKIRVTYAFEEYQLLKFEVYDIDDESKDLNDHDFLGEIEVPLGEIVTSSAVKSFERRLDGPYGKGKHGSINILAEEVSSCKEDFTIQLGAKNLPNRFFGKNSYFYEIHKATERNGYVLVYRSETIKGWQCIFWKPVTISSYSLCSGDENRSIKITTRRYKSNGAHKVLGSCFMTVRELIETRKEQLPFRHESKRSKIEMTLINFTKGSHSTFLDFIRIGKVDMHCYVAIDFTSSNGSPSKTSSLHHMDPYRPNQYQTALRAVLEIIQDYDSDKLFPVLGFGAKIPLRGDVSHCFYANMHPSNPYCEGLDGVMAAYANALPQVVLHGPTNFAPIINHVSRFAGANKGGSDYFVLLILTDGKICDMPETVDAIVAASRLPMSIIIVGVGLADFSSMDVLDADEQPLFDSNGCLMARDVVQFVPFNDVLRKANGNMTLAKVDLAREVLFEVPAQFLSYMKPIGMTAEKLAAKRSKKID